MGNHQKQNRLEGYTSPPELTHMASMNLSAVLMLTSSLLASGSALASSDLQPANSSTHSLSHPIHPTSWDCPEYGLNIYGNDITSYSNISSWQECGRLCYAHETCSHWSWTIPRCPGCSNAKRCWLHNSDGGIEYDGDHITGAKSCTF